MHRLRISFLAAAVALIVAAAPMAASTSFKIPASAGWVSTGITVTGGQHLAVRTLGFAITAPIPDFLDPGVAISGSGPGGQSFQGFTCGDIEPFVDPDEVGECAVDDAFFGELVGRVGDVTFAIGDTSTIVIPGGASGVLELAVNDFTLTYFDNLGGFRILFL